MSGTFAHSRIKATDKESAFAGFAPEKARRARLRCILRMLDIKYAECEGEPCSRELYRERVYRDMRTRYPQGAAAHSTANYLPVLLQFHTIPLTLSRKIKKSCLYTWTNSLIYYYVQIT